MLILRQGLGSQQRLGFLIGAAGGLLLRLRWCLESGPARCCSSAWA